jgi:hypothetical protein
MVQSGRRTGGVYELTNEGPDLTRVADRNGAHAGPKRVPPT